MRGRSDDPPVSGRSPGAAPVKIMVRRDSFGELMRDTLAANYSESVLVHQLVFDNDMIKKEKPDIFVYEVVERNVTSLLNFVYE